MLRERTRAPWACRTKRRASGYRLDRGKTGEQTFEHLIPVRILAVRCGVTTCTPVLRAYSTLVSAGSRRIEYRLLDKKYAPVPGESAHQVLRTLKYEIPAQVREANQIGLI